jgi:hypothetical protein
MTVTPRLAFRRLSVEIFTLAAFLKNSMQMRGEWLQRQNLNHTVMIIPNKALFAQHFE